jgi:hypothetical protein
MYIYAPYKFGYNHHYLHINHYQQALWPITSVKYSPPWEEKKATESSEKKRKTACRRRPTTTEIDGVAYLFVGEAPRWDLELNGGREWWLDIWRRAMI